MNLFKRLNKIVFSTGRPYFFKDTRLWLLLIGINIGANLGFSYLFPEAETLIFFFFLLCIISLRHKSGLTESMIVYISFFILIFLLQSIYLSVFSVHTTIRYVLMIIIGVMLVNLCGKEFPFYFSGIIFVYAVISLFCYFYILSGGSIPYYPIQDTTIDDGIIMRVYNIYYTQLGNPEAGSVYAIRNCGPFWEPGAFQGFLNLSLWFELTVNRKKDIYWKIRVAVFIVTILTTLSTGGYVVLFTLFLFQFLHDKENNSAWKIMGMAILLVISIYAYMTIEFLGNKIENDEGRLSFSFTNFPNVLYAFAGYGYAIESFLNSSISSSSSIFNLFRYMGVLGFLGYMIPLFFNKTNRRISYFIILSLILMNEPFLSFSLIWWGMPFVFYEVNSLRSRVVEVKLKLSQLVVLYILAKNPQKFSSFGHKYGKIWHKFLQSLSNRRILS